MQRFAFNFSSTGSNIVCSSCAKIAFAGSDFVALNKFGGISFVIFFAFVLYLDESSLATLF